MSCEKYTYRVTWSEADKEYIGQCAEFPSWSWLADSQLSALTGIINVVKDVLADMQAEGEEIPVPLSERAFSGKFVIRTTPEVHRRLVIQAAEAGVSLNRYVNTLL